MLGLQNPLLRASNRFASALRVNIASKSSSLPSNHRANHLRRDSVPMLYSVEPTYPSVWV